MTVVVVGSANMDLVVRQPRWVEPGETMFGTGFSTGPGGKGLNQAVACARAGAAVSLVGAVGDDQFGERLRRVVADEGIDVSRLVTDAAPTGVAAITVTDDGENAIVVVPGANDAVVLDDADRAAIRTASHLVVQLERPTMLLDAAMRVAREHGVTTVLTPAPVRDGLDDLIALADILVPNEGEAVELSGELDGEAAAVALSRIAGTVIVTLGARGAVVARSGAVIRRVPARSARAVDTTAAGDTFVGVLVAWLAIGADLDAALEAATAAAAITVTRPGAADSMPRRDEIVTALASPRSSARWPKTSTRSNTSGRNRRPMKKLINEPGQFVDEVIEGLLLAHGDRLTAASDDARALVRTDLPPRTVGIVTGGGSGHLPLFLGYVGRGLCSGVAVGNVFSSPSAEQIHRATVASDTGEGVLYLYGNYGGDVFNFDLAADLADLDGIRTLTVLGADDVASAPRERAETRRGVAGIFFAYKIAGASAWRGDDLDEVARLAQRAVDATGTMGVGLSPTVLPTTGKESFSLEEGQMEIGIGIHGEPGRRTGPIETADAVTDELLGTILADRGIGEGDRVAVLVNGLGATPLEELYVIYRRTHRLLADTGVSVHRAYVGEYATSLEMAGVSVSVLRLDDELQSLLDAPVDSPFFTQEA